MKIFIIILFTFYLSTGCGKQTEKTIEWGDGRKEIKYYPDKKDTLTYLREFYYANGQLGTIGQYTNGKMDSTWIWYYPNGNIQSLAFLDNGLYIKERTHWYADGNAKSKEFIDVPCDHDCCDGHVLYYDTLNVLKQKVTIKNGLRQDTFYQYWKDGSIFIMALYKNDQYNGFYREYHDNEKKWVLGQYVDGKKEGMWEWYDTSGILTSRNYFRNDVPIK